jgi:hypothetical protein
MKTLLNKKTAKFISDTAKKIGLDYKTLDSLMDFFDEGSIGLSKKDGEKALIMSDNIYSDTNSINEAKKILRSNNRLFSDDSKREGITFLASCLINTSNALVNDKLYFTRDIGIEEVKDCNVSELGTKKIENPHQLTALFKDSDRVFFLSLNKENKLETISEKYIFNIKEINQAISDSKELFPEDDKIRKFFEELGNHLSKEYPTKERN